MKSISDVIKTMVHSDDMWKINKAISEMRDLKDYETNEVEIGCSTIWVQWIWAHLYLVPFTRNEIGGLTQALVVMQEVTERIMAEKEMSLQLDEIFKTNESLTETTRELRRSENSLRKANNGLNILNTITRHDAMNQLTVIQGFATIMEEADLSAQVSRLREEDEQIGPGHSRTVGILQDVPGHRRQGADMAESERMRSKCKEDSHPEGPGTAGEGPGRLGSGGPDVPQGGLQPDRERPQTFRRGETDDRLYNRNREHAQDRFRGQRVRNNARGQGPSVRARIRQAYRTGTVPYPGDPEHLQYPDRREQRTRQGGEVARSPCYLVHGATNSGH